MSGQNPSDIEVFMVGHKQVDPSNPEQLCSQTDTNQMVSFVSKLYKVEVSFFVFLSL
jgi:hypothetical protein